MGEWKEKKNRAPDLKYLERESLKKGDSDTGTAADVELVMKKYDRESNTRVWQGKPASIIRWLSVLFSVYSIYVTLFPCNECAKAIIQSGLREVVYDSDKYADTAGVMASKKMLRAAGVTLRRYEHTGRNVSLGL